MIKKSKYIFSIIGVCLFLTSCSGLFATDKKLSREFHRDIQDRELSVFYTPLKDNITVAVKNVGNSFMTNLNIAFECMEKGQTITEIYSIGNLKSYFSKNLSVPINFYQCEKITVSYSFIPMPDGGYGMSTGRNFIDPINPVENTLIIK